MIAIDDFITALSIEMDVLAITGLSVSCSQFLLPSCSSFLGNKIFPDYKKEMNVLVVS